MTPYKIFMHLNNGTACDYYRAILPFKELAVELAAENLELTINQNMSLGQEYDCYIFHRNITPSFFPFLHDLKFKHGKKIVWDLDDNLFCIPEWSPANEMMQKGAKEFLAYCLDWADIITVTSDRFKNQLKSEWQVKTLPLPNLITLNDWTFPKETRSGPTRILWAGSITHSEDLNLTVEAIDAAVETYGDKVHFYFMGQIPERLMLNYDAGNYFRKYQNRITLLGSAALSYYPAAIRCILPDIALMPLTSCPFNEAKSNIKYLEMTMAGAMCLASPVGPYADTINNSLADDGGDGYLVADEYWRDNLNAAIRTCISKYHANALETVKSKYTWQSPARDKWLNFFRALSS